MFSNRLYCPKPGLISICSVLISFFPEIFFSKLKIESRDLLSLLNSKSSKILFVSWISFTFNRKSSISKSTGTSVIIVASFFDRIPNSLLSSIFSFIFPFNLEVFSSKPSIEPNSFKNFFARCFGIPYLASKAHEVMVEIDYIN